MTGSPDWAARRDSVGETQCLFQRGFIESTDGSFGLLTDNCHGHGAEASRNQIAVRVEIGFDVPCFEQHAGA